MAAARWFLLGMLSAGRRKKGSLFFSSQISGVCVCKTGCRELHGAGASTHKYPLADGGRSCRCRRARKRLAAVARCNSNMCTTRAPQVTQSEQQAVAGERRQAETWHRQQQQSMVPTLRLVSLYLFLSLRVFGWRCMFLCSCVPLLLSLFGWCGCFCSALFSVCCVDAQAVLLQSLAPGTRQRFGAFCVLNQPQPWNTHGSNTAR